MATLFIIQTTNPNLELITKNDCLAIIGNGRYCKNLDKIPAKEKHIINHDNYELLVKLTIKFTQIISL